ncbi:phage holin family protein, partial [Enterococcus faecalis]|uniref:phage holin family protein n=1 Tax=Enterococcus faecalis TaxID=1351 RepID=UPI00403F0680
VAAALLAVLNAVLPPIVAALRLPFTLATGFVLVLVVDALALLVASKIDDQSIRVDSFGWALLAALVISAVSLVLEVIFGANDD